MSGRASHAVLGSRLGTVRWAVPVGEGEALCRGRAAKDLRTEFQFLVPERGRWKSCAGARDDNGHQSRTNRCARRE